MITFKYTDDHQDEYGTGVSLQVTTTHEHIKGLVDAFKTFLIHVGHHSDNVEAIKYDDNETHAQRRHFGT